MQTDDRGLHGGAHVTEDELVKLQRQLYVLDPETYRRLLARSLYDSGTRFSVLERWEDARAALSESIELRRYLLILHPEADAHSTDLAMSLQHIAVYYSNLGLWQEACAASIECTDLRRRLYTSDPDSHRTHLAATLHNLGYYFCQLGVWDDAQSAAAEAVILRRQLYTTDPNTYRAALANSLYDLGSYLSELGRWEDARAAAIEAVGLRRDLFMADPDAHRADLVRFLQGLGVYLYELRLWEDAHKIATERVELHRQLFALNPEEYGVPLADSLQLLSTYRSWSTTPPSSIPQDRPRTIRTALSMRTSIAPIMREPPPRSTLTMPLAEFCTYVQDNTDTAKARVVSLQRRRYKGGVRHEFLLVHAQMFGGLNIWIRLERDAKRRYGIPIPSLKALLAIFPVNDTAILAHREARVSSAILTRLVAHVSFPFPPSLLELTDLLKVMAEESPEYETLRENCWFFSSIVQELSTEVYGGTLNGVLHHADRSAATRARIWARIQAAGPFKQD